MLELIFVIIILIVVVLFFRFFLFGRIKEILLNSNNKTRNFLLKFRKNDSFWDEQQMFKMVNSLFVQVQIAFKKDNFELISNYITPSLLLEIKKWNIDMKKEDCKFHVAHINIERVTIIGAHDFIDNSKDAFSVEITATLIRYFYYRFTLRPINEHTKEVQLITDIYTFIRIDNKWLLNKIQNNSSLMEILKAKKVFDEPKIPNKPKST